MLGSGNSSFVGAVREATAREQPMEVSGESIMTVVVAWAVMAGERWMEVEWLMEVN